MENISIQTGFQDIEEKASCLPVQVKSLGSSISDDATLKRVNDAKVYIRSVRKEIKNFFEPMKTKAYAAYKEIDARWKEIERPAIEAEAHCDRLLAGYFAEQRRLKEEAERAERERIRKQKEEEEAALKAALEAEEKGQPQVAETILNTAAAAPPSAKISTPEKPKLENVHSRLDYDFEITDPDAIPREYLMPNEMLIRRVVKASKGKVSIPGIKVIAKEIVVTRGV